MKVWKIVKKTLPFFGTRPFLRDFVRLDAHEGVFGKGGERVKAL